MIPSTVRIEFWNNHPSGTRPGWMPRIFADRNHRFFAINWRDKELMIEWSASFDKRSTQD